MDVRMHRANEDRKLVHLMQLFASMQSTALMVIVCLRRGLGLSLIPWSISSQSRSRVMTGKGQREILQLTVWSAIGACAQRDRAVINFGLLEFLFVVASFVARPAARQSIMPLNLRCWHVGQSQSVFCLASSSRPLPHRTTASHTIDIKVPTKCMHLKVFTSRKTLCHANTWNCS